MYFWIYGVLAAVLTFVGFALADPESKSDRVWIPIVAGIFFGLLGWLFMPVFAWNFYENWILLLLLGVCLVVGVYGRRGSYEEEVSKFALVLIGLAAMGIMVIMPLTTWSLLHADSYRKLLGTPVESQFSADVSPVDSTQYRIVDAGYALQIGNKRVEGVPGLGSRVDLDTLTIQRVNGCFSVLDDEGVEEELCFNDKLVWVGPLAHSGFFKWWANNVTPGYVMVSATDPSNVHLVTAIKPHTSMVASGRTEPARMGTPVTRPNGYTDLAIRYFHKGGYFGDYIVRHLRTNGYASMGLIDYVFEIDDNGRPYWVVTKFERRVGFSGEDTVGVVVIDAQTGEISDYSLANTPAWVDRMQPEDIVTAQLDNWGDFVHGFWNALFAKRDVVETTPGMELVYGADGKAYWYSGIQSGSGSAQATNSFVMVNARTKEVRRYMVAGASEQAAQASAQNAKGVREAGFTASSPILYNVGGEPTYFMPLKGGDGLVKMFAFVSVANYEVTGVGRTVPEALRDYQVALVNRGRNVRIDDVVQRKRIETFVVAVAKEGDFYYLRLEGQVGQEFFASSNVSPELKWTMVGHAVVIEVDVGESPSVPIVRFDNKDLAISTFN